MTRDELVRALGDAISPKSCQPHPSKAAGSTTLLYPSETDAPLDIVVWQMNSLDGESLRQRLQLSLETPLEERPVSVFFDRVTCDNPSIPCAWQGADAPAWAQHYQTLRDVMQAHLRQLTFYRVGRVEISAYVVGQYDPITWIGIHTLIVET